MAVSVHCGRHRGVGVGTPSGRRAVDRDAAVPSQRRPDGAGADAGRRDQRACGRIPSGRGVGRHTVCGAVGFVGAGAMVSMLWNLPPDPRDAEIGFGSSRRRRSPQTCIATSRSDTTVAVVTMYGITEAFPIAYKSVSDEGVPGTSGRSIPAFRGADCRFARPGRTPTGMVGEIACRATESTCDERGVRGVGVRRASLQSTRIRSGSAPVISASWTATGNLTYVDRVKDSLRRRGENISSVEVETDGDASSSRVGGCGGRNPQ